MMEFIDNGYWLWTACWKANEILEMQMAMGGGEGMFMSEVVIPAQAGIQFDTESEPEVPYADMPMSELVSLVRGIYAVLDAADTAIAEDAENIENWLEIKDFLEDVLNDIKASRQ